MPCYVKNEALARSRFDLDLHVPMDVYITWKLRGFIQ